MSDTPPDHGRTDVPGRSPADERSADLNRAVDPAVADVPRPAAQGRPRAATRVAKTAQNAMLAGVSLVWLVPILALVVTLGLAWNSWSQRGALVEVAFTDATGITPGETVLKFREVAVGKVETVRFSTDLSQVILGLRVDKDVTRYIDHDAQFWIVRPQVSASGISRLDTVLTGVFIEGDWDASVGEPQVDPFPGLDRPPLIRANEPGSWVVLASDTAKGLNEGAPVFYRGVRVGRMENVRLSPDEEGVLADAFIEAPHDRRLTTATVFWDTAGLSVSLGAQGLALNVGSLSSLLQGGIQFETLTSGGNQVEAGHIFRLQANEDDARNSLFAEGDAGELRLTVLVDNAVRGLAKGADVQFRGLSVGRVTDLKLRVMEGPGTAREVLQDVTIAVLPTRLGLSRDSTREQALAFLSDHVAKGLRARVASAGFLGTSLMIELAEVPSAAPAALDVDEQPFPVIPSAPGDITDFTATAQGFISKVGALPLGETLQSIRGMADSINALASADDTRQVPASVRAMLEEAQSALAEVRQIAADLSKNDTVAKTGAAVDATQRAATALADAVAGVPQAVQSFDQVARNAAEVDLKALGEAATGAATGLRDVVATDAARQLPQRISTALSALEGTAAEVKGVVTDLRATDAPAKLASMLDEAQAAATAVRLAAADVPEMVDKIDSAATSVDEFDFAGVSAEAEGLLADLRAMLGTEDAAELPRNLSNTLKSASGLLDDLRSGGAAGNLNGALGSAKVAADDISAAAKRLPQLAQRYEQLAARAEGVIAAYGSRSTFNTETIAMIRELRRATAAFGQLATTIERNPRAFILGR